MSTVVERVQAGAKFLDEKFGKDWPKRINIGGLDMRVPVVTEYGQCGCIFAQLDEDQHSYVNILNQLELSQESCIELGFNADRRTEDPIWDDLGNAWIAEIEKRLAGS